MRLKANIMDDKQIRRTLIRMSHEIIELNRGTDRLILLGIRRRGEVLAKEISQIIKAVENDDIPVCGIDVSTPRDDLSPVKKLPAIDTSELPFPIKDSNIIIVNDVLYTGRTVRIAMEAITESKPHTVQLAVLIDRGNRELPIGASYVGKVLSTTQDELVSVSVQEIDGVSSVDVFTLNDD